jgi:hypothetical protein
MGCQKGCHVGDLCVEVAIYVEEMFRYPQRSTLSSTYIKVGTVSNLLTSFTPSIDPKYLHPTHDNAEPEITENFSVASELEPILLVGGTIPVPYLLYYPP